MVYDVEAAILKLKKYIFFIKIEKNWKILKDF
jgi:hypothetical protein